MKAYELARVKSLILQRVQREGSTLVNTATELLDYINIAGEEYMSHLQTLRPEAFIKSTTLRVGSSDRALPASFDKLISLHLISNGYRYPLATYDHWDTVSSNTESWGARAPKYQLRLHSGTWHLHFDSAPSPTATLSMLYRVAWVNFTTSAATHTIKLPWIDGLILRAAKLCAQKEKDWELVGALTGEIERHDKKTEIWASPADEHGTSGFVDVRGGLGE